MVLTQPIWLLLLIPLALAWWVWPAPAVGLRVLRAVLVVFVVLAMCVPALRLSTSAGTVVVIADRSRSMPPDAEAQQRELIELIDRARGARDRLAVVSFGARAAVERPPEAGGTFDGFSQGVGPDASNLDAAIERGLSLVVPGEPARLLVLSDGLWTGAEPVRAAGRAAAQQVAIDYRLLSRGRANDVAIERVEGPRRVAEDESFLLHAWVRAPRAQRLTYALYRDGQRLSDGERQVTAGLTRLTFRERVESAGVHRYEVRVQVPEEDPLPENNRARWLVDVAGRRPVLVVTESNEPALARLLERGGLDVRAGVPGSVDWSLAALDGYAAVVMENVPAWAMADDAMRMLGAWVQQQGGGLLMTGGERSFGPGGYFESPLATVLPVSMELRPEHRKLSLGVVVALDRSGSMRQRVGGGRTKMELANLGTARVLDMLTPLDELGVLAVDTRPHEITPMQRVPSEPGALRDRLLRMESMGGGIYIYEALTAAYEMLQESDAGTRHLILFSDAADSVREQGYRELLETYEREGITVSVIGLGTRGDKDAALLEDIARRGGGRIFFTADPGRLPELFAEDMMIVERSAFIREPTPLRATAGLGPILGRAVDEPPAAGGYNLTYLREGATPAILTADEFTAPFVAAWQAGLGRTAVYTGEADGAYTGPIGQWGSIGELFNSLVRWTAGEIEPLPETMMLRQEVDRGVYRVLLELDPHRPMETTVRPPVVRTLHEQDEGEPEAQRTRMRWVGADLLAAEVPIDAQGAVLTRVDVPDHGRMRLPPVALPYSPEFAPVQDDGRQMLRRLARITGGEERVDLGGLWQAMDRAVRYRPIAHWLLVAAALVLLMEVLERRTAALAELSRRWRARRGAPGSGASAPSAGATAGGGLHGEARAGDGSGRRQAPAPGDESAGPATSGAARESPGAPADGSKASGSDLGSALSRARHQADRRHRKER